MKEDGRDTVAMYFMDFLITEYPVEINYDLEANEGVTGGKNLEQK